MNLSFDNYSDNFNSSRKKYIHSVGTVGGVEFQADSNPFTGIFQGCSHVILRLSCAKEPDESAKTATGAYDNFTPGFGIKFLRDGVPSGNTVAMYSVNGQDSWNFFKNDLSNHIPAADGMALKALQWKFSGATPYTGMMGLKDMARYDQNGKDWSNSLKIPYKLVFKPDSDIQSKFTDYWSGNFLDQLESIPKGSVIYQVYASETPMSEPFQIGRLVSTTNFTKSKFGDKDLFFRHGRMDDDFALHPEWKNEIKAKGFHKWFKEKFGFLHP